MQGLVEWTFRSPNESPSMTDRNAKSKSELDSDKNAVIYKACYEFEAPNKATNLGERQVQFEYEGISYQGAGNAILNLVPKPRVDMLLNFGDQHLLPKLFTLLSGIETDLKIERWGTLRKVKGLARLHSFEEDRVCLSWVPLQEPMQAVGGDKTALSRVVFHIFNFSELYTLKRKEKCELRAEGNVSLKANGWRIEIHPCSDMATNVQTLKEMGGYALTHIAHIERDKGCGFNGEDADKMLLALGYFLSFARGNWSVPVCPVGLDDTGKRVWEQWNGPRAAWAYTESWFDIHHAHALTDLFPGFMRLWNRPGWQDTLHEVLYWYLNANNSNHGIDPGIILAQSALERLAYEYAVRDRGLIESQGFKNLRASDKLRLLLASLDIPLTIPPNLTHLSALGRKFKWIDLPHGLTEFRNMLVHPEKKDQGDFKLAHFEAWRAFLWLIDVAMLRLCGYEGEYSNRLTARWVGEVERVPGQATDASLSSSEEEA